MTWWSYFTRDDFVTNLVAGLVIFLFEVIILSLTVPQILKMRADRVWRAARGTVGKILYEERLIFGNAVSDVFEEATAAPDISKDLVVKLRSAFDRLDQFESLKYMTASFTPDLAQEVAGFASHMTTAHRILQSWSDEEVADFLRVPEKLRTPIDWSKLGDAVLVLEKNESEHRQVLESIVGILKATQRYRLIVVPLPGHPPAPEKEPLVVLAEGLIEGLRTRRVRPGFKLEKGRHRK
jgi:hypothetical protein